MDTVDFTIPDWAICPLFNSDETGITDEESKLLEDFSNCLLDQGIRAIPMSCEEVGFLHANDIDSFAGDCHTATFSYMEK